MIHALEAIRPFAVGGCMAVGCFFVVVAAVGLVRFPDFYSRMHPAGKCDTLGQGMILLGLVLHEGLSFVSVKLLLIVVFIFIINPTATHAVAKAAHVAGVKPWTALASESEPGAGSDEAKGGAE